MKKKDFDMETKLLNVLNKAFDQFLSPNFYEMASQIRKTDAERKRKSREDVEKRK